jgi:hypothetical protein
MSSATLSGNYDRAASFSAADESLDRALLERLATRYGPETLAALRKLMAKRPLE